MGLYEEIRKQLQGARDWTELWFTVVLEGEYRGVDSDRELDQVIQDNADRWRAECEDALISGLRILSASADAQGGSWGVRNPRIVSGRVEAEATGSGGDPATETTVGLTPTVLLMLSAEVLLGPETTRQTYADMIQDSIGSERWRAAKVV